MSAVTAAWPVSSRITAPGAGEARIWTADLEPGAAAIDRFVPLLSADERERAERFHFRRDAMRWIAARAVLREILGGCLGADPRALTFTYGDKGKPALAAPAGPLWATGGPAAGRLLQLLDEEGSVHQGGRPRPVLSARAVLGVAGARCPGTARGCRDRPRPRGGVDDGRARAPIRIRRRGRGRNAAGRRRVRAFGTGPTLIARPVTRPWGEPVAGAVSATSVFSPYPARSNLPLSEESMAPAKRRTLHSRLIVLVFMSVVPVAASALIVAVLLERQHRA